MSAMDESEQSVAGMVFRDPSIVLTLGIDASDFEYRIHAEIWAWTKDLVERGSRLTLADVERQRPELSKYCRALADASGWHMPEDLRSHAAAVKEAARRRRLKHIAKVMAEQADDLERSPDEIAAEMIGALASNTSAAGIGKRGIGELIVEAIKKPPPIFSTGLPTLDAVIGGGLVAGKLYGIAARKKVGKTVLLGTISHNLNRALVNHLFVAMEMSPVEIEQRNMAREFGINSVQFLKPQSTFLERRAADYASSVADCTVYEHSPGMSFDDLKSAIARATIHHRISGVVVDYWQLVGGKPKGETEEYHLRNVAQGLSDICRKKGLWCLIAAQVNQDGNTRGGEGLKLACDIYFTLHREKDDHRAWLDMEESRYVLYASVGSEMSPGLLLNKHGPFFEDANAVAEVPAYDPLTGEFRI